MVPFYFASIRKLITILRFSNNLKNYFESVCSHFFRLCFCGSRLQGNRETSGLWELLLVTTYPGVPVLVMVVCYSVIFHKMRESRKRVEGCGASLVSNIQKREINFSRMLCYIFVRCSALQLVILMGMYLHLTNLLSCASLFQCGICSFFLYF